MRAASRTGGGALAQVSTTASKVARRGRRGRRGAVADEGGDAGGGGAVAAVEDGDVVAAGDGEFGDGAADEAGAAEHEQSHGADCADRGGVRRRG